MAKRNLNIFVIKRDNRKEQFDNKKIFHALKSAFEAIESSDQYNDEYINGLVKKVEKEIIKLNQKEISVEVIQDIVENILLKSKEKDIAKEYIRYRAKRTQSREAKTGLITLYKQIHESSAEKMDLKRDNANVNGNSSMGAMLKLGSESNKYYLLEHVLKKEYAQAHKDGYIHIHK